MENYLTIVFLGQTNITCTLLQSFNEFINQTFNNSHTGTKFEKVWIIKMWYLTKQIWELHKATFCYQPKLEMS